MSLQKAYTYPKLYRMAQPLYAYATERWEVERRIRHDFSLPR